MTAYCPRCNASFVAAVRVCLGCHGPVLRDDEPIATAHDWHAYLTRLAIEAGADPARARERMSQAAQAVVLELASKDVVA